MHDPFPSIWRDRLAALPRAATLTLAITPNVEAEDLSCLVCRGPRCEWVIMMRSAGERIFRGLHEACRRSSEKLREMEGE